MSKDDEDSQQSGGLTRATMARLLRIATGKPEPSTETGAVFDKLAARAAVVGTFTPRGLTAGLDMSTVVKEALDQVLAKSSVVTVDRQRRWILDPSIRASMFAQLGARAVNVLMGFKAEFQDPLSVLLAQLLRGQAPTIADIPVAHLRILVNAANWAAQASEIARKMLSSWQQELQRRELLDPLRALVGTDFSGRVKELKDLRDYVDIVAPTSFFDGWSRWLSNTLRKQADRPFLLHGIGGIGKSTLVARFILEHAAVAGERGFPFVYLDFDRSVLDPMNGLSLLADAARQLEAQFPQAAESLRKLQVDLVDRAAASRIDSGSASPLAASRGGVIEQRIVSDASIVFMDVLRESGLADRPFLLVLDTFEEVQARGELAVDAVFDWLDALASRQRIKTIIAGRAPVPDRSFAKVLPLGNLDKSSALQFLAVHDVPSKVAREIVSYLGGNPLSLKLAVRLLLKEDSAPAEWIHIDGEKLRKGLDDVRIQGYLQTRLLAHIHDDRVRALVHPGLILRRITAEVIQMVLAPMMQMAVLSRKDAQVLYEGLRTESSLVVDLGEALMHRREPRSVMLPLQRANEPQLFKRLSQAAVDYYGRGESVTDQIELTYHRLMLEENPYEVLGGTSLEVIRGLGSSTEDLPPTASLLVRLLLSRPLTKGESRQLPDGPWETYAFQTAVRLLGSGALRRPLALLKERPHLADSPLLSYPLALALFRSLDWQGADAALVRATRYRPSEALGLPFEMLDAPNIDLRARVERGHLLWYRSLDSEAAAEFAAAQSLSEGRDRALKIEALLGQLVVGSQLKDFDKERHYALRANLLHEVSAMSETEWRVNLATLRRVAFLGCASDVAAKMALSLLGLQLRSRDGITDFLSEFEADLDDALAERLLSHIKDAGSGGYGEFLTRTRALAVLERDIAAQFIRSNTDVGRRALPFVRGRYTTWRIPIRSGILSVFPELSSFQPVLERTMPDLVPTPSDSAADYRNLIEDAIEAAEHRDLILELVHNCAQHAEERRHEVPQLHMLSNALARYSQIIDSAHST